MPDRIVRVVRTCGDDELEVAADIAVYAVITRADDADLATLDDAMAHPGRHATLYVRMYGFAEFFTSLPRAEQQERVRRTAY